MSIRSAPLPQFPARMRARIAMRRFGGLLEEPFHRRKAIFVHIPKAAGSAVSQQVFDCQVGHLRIAELAAADAKSVSQYFSFAFVRDPLDRFVSASRFLAAGGNNSKDAQFSRQHLRGLSLLDIALQLTHKSALRKKVHFQPQVSFLTLPAHPDRIAVDYIGRFETIAADFSEVASKLGLASNLPVRNATPQRSKSPNEVDDELREVVRFLYARDYELLGY